MQTITDTIILVLTAHGLNDRATAQQYYLEGFDATYNIMVDQGLDFGGTEREEIRAAWENGVKNELFLK